MLINVYGIGMCIQLLAFSVKTIIHVLGVHLCSVIMNTRTHGLEISEIHLRDN